MNGEPTIDEDRLSGDVGGGAACQEHRGAREVLGQAVSSAADGCRAAWTDHPLFSVAIPETGLCVTGGITAAQGIGAVPHGACREGGCTEPVGGH